MPRITNLQVRRSNAATWTSTNPVLASGEIGFETDNLRFKIGNGSNTWTNLAYQAAVFNGGTITNTLVVTNTAGVNTSGQLISTIATGTAPFVVSSATRVANLSVATASSVVETVAGTASAELVRGNMADNDQFRILVGGTATNAGFAEIATADDGTEPIHVRQYTGIFTTLVRTATLLDGSGNTSFPGTVSATALTANNLRLGYSTTVTAAGTTTLTATSNYQQFFTGTTTQTVQLPAPQTLAVGATFLLVNNSTGNISVIASNSAATATLLAGTMILLTCVDITAGLGAANWNVEIVGFSGLTGTGNTVLSTSPTLTTPSIGSATATRVNYGAGTIGAPTFTSYSAGVKKILYDNITAASAGYTIGIDADTFWHTIPAANASQSFKWYGGTTEVARLGGTGILTASSYVSNVSTGTAPLTVTSTTQVANLNVALSGSTTNVLGGAAGSLPYQSAVNTTVYLARTATNNATLAFNSSTNAPFWIAPTLSNTYYAATTSAQLAGVISDETGSGALVFGTTPVITPADAVAATAATQAGYIGMPQNSRSGAYTLVAGDAGKHIYYTVTGQTVTIPNNTAVAFQIGTAITFITAPSVSLSIAITTDTLRLANTATTGTRTLAANGVATAIKVTSTAWIISGNGLT